MASCAKILFSCYTFTLLCLGSGDTAFVRPERGGCIWIFLSLFFAQILKYIVCYLCDTITWQIVIKLLFIHKSANFFDFFLWQCIKIGNGTHASWNQNCNAIFIRQFLDVCLRNFLIFCVILTLSDFVSLYIDEMHYADTYCNIRFMK